MSKEIAVIGSADFTTGFRLAGIRKFATIPNDPETGEVEEAVTSMLEDDDVGIIVMHDPDIDVLSRSVRERLETSVDPVLVTLGGGAGSGGLRDQIKRAVGIDLMEED
ncbi:V-type ATP synthase subunit F protein [Halorhabdus tiamatea SARL4B]|uniref:A-type ATP synthase subunit F n=1 Tax=Halorhabdus tiamatea SARL4B TaxID=1033806 RepID=F7PNN1_9EURY|nr:V-type ATP synthase subunit F [Halorhabdus tiamatea]ERJ05274.1 V-type ATP synthase subunit F protein [Halorhabdus tiamatea SARL4B]CCQ33733.1 V-type ATP synthase subunit F [Halorhabdus tiamatea SARL4B]